MMQLLLDFYLDVPNKSMVKHYQVSLRITLTSSVTKATLQVVNLSYYPAVRPLLFYFR